MAKKPVLYAEWVDYMETYRLYNSQYPQQTVAYIDSIQEAKEMHPEYDYWYVVEEEE